MHTTLTLTGTILNRSYSLSLNKLNVQLWSIQQPGNSPLATAVTDDKGQFVVQLSLPSSGLAQAVEFRILREGELLEIADDGIKWGGRSPNRTVRIMVHDKQVIPDEPGDDPLPDGDGTRYVVCGKVLQANGPSVVGATVTAIHKQLRSEVELGQGTSDKEGAYEIEYSLLQGEQQIDLQVRVEENREVIAESGFICPANEVEEVDLIIDGDSYKGYSEFEQLEKALQPHLGQIEPADLNADDVTLLTCKVGYDATYVAYYIRAARSTRETQLPSAFFYGLFRNNMPTALSSLLSQNRTVLRNAFESAIRNNIVPASLESQTDSIFAQLVQVTVTHALKVPVDDGAPSLTGLLSLAGLSDIQQQEILLRYAKHEGDTESFWSELKADPDLQGSLNIESLQFSLQLANLTGNHLPLVETLLARKRNNEINSIKDLVGFDVSDWEAIVADTDVPDAITGDTEEDRQRTYAETINNILERAFPTEKVIAGIRDRNQKSDTDLIRFFDNSTDFGFTDNIDRYVRDNANTVWNGVGNREGVTSELKSLQRVYKLSPESGRFDVMTSLREAGYDSALAITMSGKERFRVELSEKLGSTTIMDEVFGKAEQVHASALALYSAYHADFHRASPFVINTRNELLNDGEGSTIDIPNWESLFGSLDYCECKHCRSIYSPAAYLVDLLQYLDQRPTTDGSRTALDLLNDRRPDIGNIELSCTNTNTVLPYLSLALEVLENVVVGTMEAYQTTWTTDELNANDEHFNPRAYMSEHIGGSLYPWSLPFNLWLEEARLYLAHLGVSLDELMHVFARLGLSETITEEPSELDVSIAGESLGFSPKERSIITTMAPSTEFWGGLDIATLSDVPTFLKQSNLEFADLLYLLDVNSIDPKNELSLALVTPCTTDEAEIQGLSSEHLDRIHRFLRLRAKLGWEIRELEEVIQAMGATDDDGFMKIDDSFIIQLSHIHQLRDDLNVPLVELLSWWSAISRSKDEQNDEDRSLYEQLFLNNTVLNPVDEAFTLAGETLATDGVLAEHIPTILAALQIGEEDLWQIAAFEGIDVQEDGSLNLVNLSTLYRNTSLARALDLDIEDFLSIRRLTNINPFYPIVSSDTSDIPLDHRITTATLDFIDKTKVINNSGLSVTELNYLFRHEYKETDGAAPTESVISQFLEELLSDVAVIAEENKFASDPAGEVTRERLSLILEAEYLDQAMAVLEDTWPVSEEDPLKSEEEQRTFIEEHFADFLTEIDVATSELVGSGALEAGVARYDYVLEPLMAYLNKALSRQYVIQKIADGFGIDTGVVEPLITDYVSSPYDVDILGALRGDFSDSTGEVTRLWLAILLDVTTLSRVMAILDDSTSESEDEQRTLIEEHLGLIFESIEDAKEKLVGGEALEQPQERYEYILPYLVQHLLPEIFQQWYVLLHKVSTVLSSLAVTLHELPWLFDRASEAGWLNLATLPLERDEDAESIASRFYSWLRLLDLYAFRDAHTAGDTSVFDILELAYSDATLEDVLEALSSLTEWDALDVNYLVGKELFDPTHPEANGLGLSYPDDYRDERYLVRLEEAFTLLDRLGLAAATVSGWNISNDLDEMEAVAQSIKSTVKSKYDTDAWLSVAEPLKDELREKRRDALVAYLLANPPDVFATYLTLNGRSETAEADDLYECYLIDVLMNACMDTSRIKQAISSVQLFAQRCLMNLEADIDFSETAAEQWEWMKNYRVWEAARKVFAYPENWIEPELRTNKSSFFEDLENELLQDEVTDETAERAFLNYLQKLDEVANLEVCALYHQYEEGGSDEAPIDIVHVVARTYGVPHIYYYRQYVDDAYWTPWEQLDLDIEGDHLVMTVWNRRLYLVWPIFLEQAEAKEVEGEEPDYYWSIQLGWSEYMNQSWTPKKLTVESLERVGPGYQKERFVLKASIETVVSASFGSSFGSTEITNPFEGTELVIFVYYSVPKRYGIRRGLFSLQGKFTFSGCNGQVEVSDATSDLIFPILPSHTSIENMRIIESEDQATSLELASSETSFNGNYKSGADINYTSTLEGNSDRFRLVVPFQYDEFVSQDHFFFADSRHSFFVTPKETSVLTYLKALSRDDSVLPDLSNVSLFYDDEERVREAVPNNSSSDSTSVTMISSVQPNEVEVILSETDTVYDTVVSLPAFTKYLFRPFYHPHVCTFIKALNKEGISGLLQRSIQKKSEAFFSSTYGPNGNAVETPYPVEEVDFSISGAYSDYNEELFFQIPLLIADRLSQNQQFEEAQKWFHYILNPTARTDTGTTGIERYWNYLPFYQETSGETIYDMMIALAEGDEDMVNQVIAWRKDPFNPHLIAGLRPTAYQKSVVMKYVDSLISWGDQLFGYDTIESINEATQLYVLAGKILGDRPETLPETDVTDTRTYNSLKDDLDTFSNALIEIEGYVAVQTGTSEDTPSMQSLYFCVPENDELLERWNTVEDRLFKIRNCMNIEGVERSLALFQPPIDPAMLVQAAASGVDIGSVLSDLNAPLPHYRFQHMLQKAVEFCSDVRSLGSALLSALEKKDAEELAMLRAGLEVKLFEAARLVKVQQVEEVKEGVKGLNESRQLIVLRDKYYEGLIDTGLAFGEKAQRDLLWTALAFQGASGIANLIGSALAAIPSGRAHLQGMASGVSSEVIDGKKLATAAGMVGQSLSILATSSSTNSTIAGIIAGFKRRMEEWEHQRDMTEQELEQIDKQIAAAEIRVEIAEQDLENHDKQINNAEAVYDFMKSKYTNKDLYSWMVSQISSLYYQSYKLAYDLAKRAQKCYQYELALPDASFINFGYYDSLKKGLLAGEKLHYDLRRMEAAYLENNKRTYELTKHISLIQLDPIALLSLKETGECYISLPEALFDLDFPGHYLRRIKSVSITIPCVIGQYTGVNCTLTLLSSSVRVSADTTRGYARATEGDDSRFEDRYGATQSIALSHAQRDSGLFELSFRDERFLPFEERGVISKWKLELPTTFKSFDHDSISDVIMHINYTARNGGNRLKQEAESELATLFTEAGAGLLQTFSARRDFPSEWHRFLSSENEEGDQVLQLDLSQDRFPYFVNKETIKITAVHLYLKPTNYNKDDTYELEYSLYGVTGDTYKGTFGKGTGSIEGLLYHKLPGVDNDRLSESPGTWSFVVNKEGGASAIRSGDNEPLDPDAVEDLIIICEYDIGVSDT